MYMNINYQNLLMNRIDELSSLVSPGNTTTQQEPLAKSVNLEMLSENLINKLTEMFGQSE